MTLLQMNYILEIDRCGSMNKAAQSLFVSQSALSSAVSEVEKELGIHIFTRSNRGIALTEEGRELVSQIVPIVESGKKLSRYYERRRDSDWVHISIAAQRYPFCAKAFVEFLQSLGDAAMQVSLKEMDMAAVIGEVSAGASDLGVIFVSDLTEATILQSLEDNNLSLTPLITLKPHVFMRRGHPLSGFAALSVEQLKPFPNVVFTQSDSNPSYAEEAVAGNCGDFDKMIYVSDRATIYNIMTHTDSVSTGSGILPAEYSDDRLIAVPLEGYHEMRLGYIHQLRRPLSGMEQRFIGILRTVMNQMNRS